MNPFTRKTIKPAPRTTLDESDAAKIAAKAAGTYVPEPAITRAARTRMMCPRCRSLLFDTEETRTRDDGMQVRRVMCGCHYRSWRLA